MQEILLSIASVFGECCGNWVPMSCMRSLGCSLGVDSSVFDRNVNAMGVGLVLADGCGDEKLVGDCREVAE